jgi:two-component system osmolarity sensor histidine kinase EnvZ
MTSTERAAARAERRRQARERNGSRPSWLKRILPRSLLGRSLLIIVSPLVLLQVISTWVFYDRHYDTITRRLTEAVAGEIAAVVDVFERRSDEENRFYVFQLVHAKLRLQVELLEGAKLEARPSPFWPSILNSKLTSALDNKLDHDFVVDTISQSKHVEIQVELADGVLHVLVPRKRLFTSTTYIFIMWMVGASVILFLVAFHFMRNQVKPIRHLARAAESFGRGLDVEGFKPEGATEVRQASHAFLRMRERIKRQIQQRTEILAGVSHDLRTPLTRMKLELAMLGDDQDIAALRHDVGEMERMIEGYLAFARGEGQEQPRHIDFTDLLTKVVTQARRADEDVELQVEPEITAQVRPEALRRCLANLIDNAQRYGGQVAVTAKRRRGGIEVLIDDNGPGIPVDKREEVFKPFFRLDDSRNPDTGGTGLGLTLARDVVRGHGGELTLDESPKGGLRARIWLPT